MTVTAASLQDNPLLEGLEVRRAPDPCTMVIFGASGDLTKRKLFPALYSLAYRQLLPEKFSVLGVARTEGTDQEFRERMKAAVQEFGRDDFREDVWDELADGMHYVYDDDKLAAALRDLGERRGTTGNRIYYLAVPPAAFEGIVAWVGKHKARKGWTRVIVEKPFGHDLESAQDLNAHAGASVRERDFRADLEPPVHRPHPDHGCGDARDRGTGRVLRAGRCDPGHLSEPPAAADRPDGDGAADRSGCRFGSEREGKGPEVDPYARAEARGPWAVRPRLHRGAGGAGVSGRGRRRSKLDDGDVHCGEALRRQLA
ncbi:MAG: hypothetical protein E6G23_03535, partial [Actinobacteria bacterium]